MAGVIVRAAPVPVRRRAVDVAKDVNVINGVAAGPGLVPGQEPRMLFRDNATHVVPPSSPQIHRLQAQMGPDAPDRSVSRIIWR